MLVSSPNPKLDLSVVRNRLAFVDLKIKKLTKELRSLESERSYYDELILQISTNRPSRESVKAIAEKILKETKRPLGPQEIYERMVNNGYRGHSDQIYFNLYKWTRQGGTSIKKVGRGQYIDESFFFRFNKDVAVPTKVKK